MTKSNFACVSIRHSLNHLFVTAAGVVVLVFLAGCSSSATSETMASEGSSTIEHATLPSLDDVFMFNGDSGASMSFEDLASRASQADIVLIGELHGHPLGLHVAAELWDRIARDRDTAALSMEFFERDEQIALDDYLCGITDEDEFRTAAGRTEGNYPHGHQRMVETAKAHGYPVIAANAPRRYVRLARTDGFERLEALNVSQRRMFNVPEELTTGRYRDDFFEAMSMIHPEDGEEPAPGMRIEDFFRSQNMWDETMATSVMTAARRRRAPVVHVVGQFHVNHEGGMQQRIEAMAPAFDVFVVSMADTWSETLTDDDRGMADCVVYVGPHPLAMAN